MWWDSMILGFDSYHVILWFLTYSILGWVVESVYMSICNRKLTNRGFVTGPFCPIYGIGALTVFFILRPYGNNELLLFVLGSLLATTIEFLTAVIMKRVFGEIWWDYNEKPFNYKGILCLESSIAWGFYTLFLFLFLQNFVEGVVDRIPILVGKIGGSLLLIIFMVDFLHSLYVEKKEDIPERVWEMKDMLIEKISRL